MINPAFGAAVSPSLSAVTSPSLGAAVSPTLGAALSPTFGATVSPALSAAVSPTFGVAASPTLGATVSPALGATVSPALSAAISPSLGKFPGGFGQGKFPDGFGKGKFPGGFGKGKFGKGGKFGQTCVTGRVDLLAFIQQPAPGSITGVLTTSTGQQIGLIQSPSMFGVPLGVVDQQIATVCGIPTFSGGQIALIVTAVFPIGGGIGAPGAIPLGI